jgi:hypothetical protein
MKKALVVLLTFQLILSVVVLYFGTALYRNRELLKGRTQKLERALVAVASTLETPSQEPAANPAYPARDIDPTTTGIIPSPRGSDFWTRYRPEREQTSRRTLDLRNKAAQFACYYRIDPVTGAPLRDPLTGARLTEGPGTLQEILTEVTERSLDQLNGLNDTRDQLRTTREELVASVTDLNGRKQELRTALKTVGDQNEAIAKLHTDLRERDGKIADAERHMLELNDTVRQDQVALAMRDEEIQDLTRDVTILTDKLSKTAVGSPPGTTPAAAAFLSRGPVGTVTVVNDEWNFVVVALNEKFLAQYDELIRKSPVEPSVEFTIKRGNGAEGRFVTKSHLNWVSLKQGLAVADLMDNWRQGDVRSGDQLLF